MKHENKADLSEELTLFHIFPQQTSLCPTFGLFGADRPSLSVAIYFLLCSQQLDFLVSPALNFCILSFTLFFCSLQLCLVWETDIIIALTYQYKVTL